MQIAMTPAKQQLFEAFLRCARRYVEFGAGGSTCLAAARVAGSVTSVDSSQDWLDQVRAACAAQRSPVSPTLIHVDVGATGSWGMPIDPTRQASWPAYHTRIWADPEAGLADLYLVDGRFRVACFMQAVLRSRPGALIAIHDFANRAEYHVVREVAQEIAVAENFSVLMRRPDYDPSRAMAILDAHGLNPA